MGNQSDRTPLEMDQEKSNAQEISDSTIVIFPEDVVPEATPKSKEGTDKPRTPELQSSTQTVRVALHTPSVHSSNADETAVIIRPDEISLSKPESVEVSPSSQLQAPIRIQPPAQEEMYIIQADEIALPQPECIISPEEIVEPTIIREPADGSQVGSRPLEVRGEAAPFSQLMLEVGDFRAEVAVSQDGKFSFSRTRLNPGWNEIRVSSRTYPEFVRSRAVIQIYRSERNLLFIGLKDIYTQSFLTEDDDVVRCRKCGTFAKLDSWQGLPGCAIYMCGSRRYWTSDDDQFNEEEPVLER